MCLPAHWLGWLLPDVTKFSVSHSVLFIIPVGYKCELDCLVESHEAIIPVFVFFWLE